MSLFVIILHVFACLALIMIVLLQTGKGAEIGATLGGAGGQALFGATGATTFLSKATTAIAILFMVTSLFLAYRSGHVDTTSIMTNKKAPIEQTQQADTPKAPVPDTEEKAENR